MWKRMAASLSPQLKSTMPNSALLMVETIANDPEPGSIYKGVVTCILTFGAFVEIAPGKEGLVHISHLDVKRTEKVEDVVNVGDEDCRSARHR